MAVVITTARRVLTPKQKTTVSRSCIRLRSALADLSCAESFTWKIQPHDDYASAIEPFGIVVKQFAPVGDRSMTV